MLRGRFGDTSGRPYIEGRLILPRLGVRGDISFLVDTGADGSVLHPADGVLMGIEYSRLTNEESSLGIGGVSKSFAEPAVLAFSEPRRFIYVYNIQLSISPPRPEIMELPSLLGRDVLDRWQTTYAPQETARLSSSGCRHNRSCGFRATLEDVI